VLPRTARAAFLISRPKAPKSDTSDRRLGRLRERYHRWVTDHNPSVSPDAGHGLLSSLAGTVTADGADLLGTREDAVPWLRTAGLLLDDAVISNSEHGALLRLRDALREVSDARAAGTAVPDAAARLTRALADGRLVVTVTSGGKAALASSARATYSNLVAAIAIAVAEAW
jgi:hypothetical protein